MTDVDDRSLLTSLTFPIELHRGSILMRRSPVRLNLLCYDLPRASIAFIHWCHPGWDLTLALLPQCVILLIKWQWYDFVFNSISLFVFFLPNDLLTQANQLWLYLITAGNSSDSHMAKNFRHMCRQQSCEKLPPVPWRGLFFSHKSLLHFRKNSRWKKRTPQKATWMPRSPGPPAYSICPTSPFHTYQDVWLGYCLQLQQPSVSGSNIKRCKLKLDFNLPNWLFLHISSKYRTFKAFKNYLVTN